MKNKNDTEKALQALRRSGALIKNLGEGCEQGVKQEISLRKQVLAEETVNEKYYLRPVIRLFPLTMIRTGQLVLTQRTQTLFSVLQRQ